MLPCVHGKAQDYLCSVLPFVTTAVRITPSENVTFFSLQLLGTCNPKLPRLLLSQRDPRQAISSRQTLFQPKLFSREPARNWVYPKSISALAAFPKRQVPCARWDIVRPSTQNNDPQPAALTPRAAALTGHPAQRIHVRGPRAPRFPPRNNPSPRSREAPSREVSSAAP